MKTESKIIAIAIVAALGLWLAAAMLDTFVFHHIPFWRALLAQIDSEDLFERAAGVLAIIILGIYFSRISQRRHRLRAALEESEKLAQNLFAEAPLPYQSLDVAGRILNVSQLWLDTLGYSTDEVIGRYFCEFLTPLCAGMFPDRFAQYRINGNVTALEVDLVKKDGTTITVSYNGKVVYDEQGKFVRTHCLFVDVSERKRAELTMSEERRRFKDIIKGTNVGTWEFDINTGISVISDRWAEMLGYTREELAPVTMQKWNVLTHPDDLQASNEALRQHFEGERDHYECELRMRHKNGNWVWVLDRGRVHTWSDDGKPLLMSGTHQDITERKRAEETLRIRESYLSAIIENQPGLVWLKDVDSRFLAVNFEFARSCGREKPENVVGLTDFDVWPREIADKYRSDDADVMKSGKSIVVEESVFDRGETKWFETFKTPVFDGQGTIIGTTGYAHDITEQRAAKDELARSEIKYRTLFESAQDAIFLMKDYLFVDCNSTTCDMFGCTREQIVLQSPVRFSPSRQPDGAESTKKALEKMNEAMAGRPQFFEWMHAKLDGTCFDAEVSLNGIRIAGDQYILAIVRDVTERMKSQKALERSLSLQRATIESTADGILVVDQVGKVSSFNQKFLEMWRIPEFLTTLEDDEKLLQYVMDQLKDPQRFIERVTHLYANPDSQSYDNVEFKDGRVFERYSQPQRVGDEVVGRVWSFRDLTERKRVEMELARLATAIEQAGEAIVITDLDGQIEYVNPAFERITGFRRDEAIGTNIAQHSTGDQEPDLYQELWRVLKGGGIWTGRLRSLRKDGSTFQAECSISPIRDQNNTIINYVGVHRDVTQEAEMENRLRQSQKLEAVGLLAAGIAHDFNNLLAGIRGFAELMTLAEEVGPKISGYAEEILKAANRAADLTGQLLAFARKGRFLSIAVNVNEVIDEVRAILKHSIDRRIEIKTDCRAERPFTSGDPSQIQSAILNLAINARDAMLDGGELTFETENVQLDDAFCQLHSLDLGPGDYLAISVTDTGIGMDEEVMAHIFDPFFTTKEQGQGTGLGLAGVYGCLKNHHGSIEVNSQPGSGSTFRLLFPVIAVENKPVPPSQRRLKLTGKERLLLVEDDEVVRKLAIKILANAGYHVTACADGLEAVALYKDKAAEFDLVLLDMMMPRMHGKETFAAMKLINPHVCALLMSGYADSDVQELLDLGIKGFIPKPFRSKQLLQKVREALDSATSKIAKQSQPQ